MIVYINTKVLNLFGVSCLKRENANHCTINYMNMIKLLFFLSFVIVFFFSLQTFLKFAQGKKTKSLGSTT